MEKITYLLGAGFSAPAGLPLMSNFILKAKETYYSNNKKYAYFQRIFNKIDELSKIKNFFNSDLYNIEEVLSLFETESILYRNTKFRKDFIQFISDVIEYYTFDKLEFIPIESNSFHGLLLGNKRIKKIYASFVCSVAGIQLINIGSPNHYEFRSERIPNNTIKYSIITLNYDTILENCMDSVLEKYPSDDLINFNKDKYDPEWENPHLVKLHGCVRNKDIIPPTWAKSTSKNIEKTWRNAYNIIKDSSQIRIMGYSLPITDSNVRYLIKSAILKNQTLKKIDVLCLDSKDSLVKSRYDDFIDFNFYDFKELDTMQFLSKLSDETLVARARFNGVIFNALENTHQNF